MVKKNEVIQENTDVVAICDHIQQQKFSPTPLDVFVTGIICCLIINNI